MINKQQSNVKTPAGIKKVTHIDLLGDEGKNTAMSKILQTREVRQMLGNALPDLLNVIAGSSRFKQFIMKSVGKYLQKGLSQPDDVLETKELHLLFEDEQFLQNVVGPMTEGISGLGDVFTSIAQTIEQLPTEEKKEVVDKLFTCVSNEKSADIFHYFNCIMNDIYRNDPEYFTNTLGPTIAKMIETIDFGDLSDFSEYLFNDVKGLVGVVNQSLFDRPAKVVLLLAMLPSIGNLLVSTVNDTVGRFNEMPPDIVADAIFSFFRQMDAKETGRLLNELFELTRKLNVGSALTGDPGRPQFRMNLKAAVSDIFEEIDGELLWKFREALEQGRDTMNHAMQSAVKKNPELMMLKLKNGPALKNYKFKILTEKLAALDDLSDQDITDALSEGFSKLDGASMAEIVNMIASLVNRIKDTDPNIVQNTIGEFINSLDIEECEEAITWIAEDIGTALTPIGKPLVSQLIKTASQWMTSGEDDDQEILDNVRAAINQFLEKKEMAA